MGIKKPLLQRKSPRRQGLGLSCSALEMEARGKIRERVRDLAATMTMTALEYGECPAMHRLGFRVLVHAIQNACERGNVAGNVRVVRAQRCLPNRDCAPRKRLGS